MENKDVKVVGDWLPDEPVEIIDIHPHRGSIDIVPSHHAMERKFTVTPQCFAFSFWKSEVFSEKRLNSALTLIEMVEYLRGVSPLMVLPDFGSAEHNRLLWMAVIDKRGEFCDIRNKRVFKVLEFLKDGLKVARRFLIRRTNWYKVNNYDHVQYRARFAFSELPLPYKTEGDSVFCIHQ